MSNKNFIKITKKLFQKGGKYIDYHEDDKIDNHDLQKLLTQGMFFDDYKIEYHKGIKGFCVHNSVLFWEKHKEYSIVSGYVLVGCKKTTWISHVWVIDAKNKILHECTMVKEKYKPTYFGYVLTYRESMFSYQNFKDAPTDAERKSKLRLVKRMVKYE